MNENSKPRDVQTFFRWSPPHGLDGRRHIDLELCTPRAGRRPKVETISHMPSNLPNSR